MIEDKLTHDERLRLECIAQAIAKNTVMQKPIATLITEAREIEGYVKGEA